MCPYLVDPCVVFVQREHELELDLFHGVNHVLNHRLDLFQYGLVSSVSEYDWADGFLVDVSVVVESEVCVVVLVSRAIPSPAMLVWVEHRCAVSFWLFIGF